MKILSCNLFSCEGVKTTYISAHMLFEFEPSIIEHQDVALFGNGVYPKKCIFIGKMMADSGKVSYLQCRAPSKAAVAIFPSAFITPRPG